MSDERRIFNFSAGPATLPLPVLEEARRDGILLPGEGASVYEISHRSARFQSILDDTVATIRELLQLPDRYHVLFLAGGASLQFSMVAMNLLRDTNRTANYVLTGSWGKKARREAEREGKVDVVWDGASENYARVPTEDEWRASDDAAYVHVTSNETIEGVQFSEVPDAGAIPLVCDASSEFLSRPIDVDRYALIYAGAQKNLGPAGVTLVILRDDLTEGIPEGLPSMLDYRTWVKSGSLYNTPPVFAIYMTGLVARWIRDDVGGLEAMAKRNRAKAERLYEAIDASDGFYRGHAHPESRSKMNVTFRLQDADLESAFVADAAQRGLAGLKGHRSVGGIRASVYNAMEPAGVDELVAFMNEFRLARQPA